MKNTAVMRFQLTLIKVKRATKKFYFFLTKERTNKIPQKKKKKIVLKGG